MPLFHGNALMALWGPALVVGATVALRPPLQRLGLPRRRAPLPGHHVQLRGQGHRLHPGHPRAPRRRGEHPGERVRHRGLVARPLPLLQAVRLRPARGLRPERGGRRHPPVPGMPTGALGQAPCGVDVAVVDPATGTSARRPSSTPRGGCCNAGEATGEIVNRAGRAVRGLLRRPRGRGRAHPPRLVLDGRPRLPRRRGLLLLRRAAGRLAAGRLGELRRRAGREGARRATPTSRWSPSTPCPTHRPGDQVMAAVELRPGATSTPRLRPRGWPTSPTSGPSGPRASCGSPTSFPRPPPAR